MVVKVKLSGKLVGILDYNEEKLQNREAECIYARNFLKDADQLSKQEKKQRFLDIAELNQRSLRTGVHIVMQFAPADRLDNKKLTDIGQEFMRRIGFDDQPYLVYRHLDAFVPHIHIVSTNLRPNGSRMAFGKKIKNIWPPLVRPLEEEFGLVKAGEKLQYEQHNPKEMIQYGKRPSLQAIGETLKYVLETYRYRSSIRKVLSMLCSLST